MFMFYIYVIVLLFGLCMNVTEYVLMARYNRKANKKYLGLCGSGRIARSEPVGTKSRNPTALGYKCI